MKRFVLVAGSVALLAVLAGCTGSGPAQTVEMQINEGMVFAQKELTVPKGTAVKLVLNNKDSQLHDLSIDKIPVKVKSEHSDSHGMGGKTPDLHVSADAGKTGSVEFVANKEGTYTFYCTVAGHKEAGMQGTLIVK